MDGNKFIYLRIVFIYNDEKLLLVGLLMDENMLYVGIFYDIIVLWRVGIICYGM